MKLVTLHQPWASLVALGLKKYETRHWDTDYRGPLLIHAAARKPKVTEWRQLPPEVRHHEAIKTLKKGRRYEYADPDVHVPYEFPLGCIVAIAYLTDCLRMEPNRDHPLTIDPNKIDPLERAVGLWEPGRYAFQLDGVRSLHQPIPFTSRQGKLLDVPSEIAQAATHQTTPIAF